MCVIVHSPKGKKLPKKSVYEMFVQNGNGAGIVYANEKGRFVVKKGIMNFNKFWEIYNKVRGEYVFHFRLATSGSLSRDNTHPFFFDGKRYCLFHNGIVNEIIDFFTLYEKIYGVYPSSKITYGSLSVISDTGLLSEILNGENYLRVLNHFVSSNNKFVVVDLHKNKIEKIGNFYKSADDDEIFVSNSLFSKNAFTNINTTSSGKNDYWYGFRYDEDYWDIYGRKDRRILIKNRESNRNFVVGSCFGCGMTRKLDKDTMYCDECKNIVYDWEKSNIDGA